MAQSNLEEAKQGKNKRILSQSPGNLPFLKPLSAMKGRQRAAWMRIACFKKGRLPGDCDTLQINDEKIDEL